MHIAENNNRPGWLEFWGEQMAPLERFQSTGLAKKAYEAGYAAALLAALAPVEPVAVKAQWVNEAGGAVVATILQDDDQIVEVQKMEGSYRLTIHSRRDESDRWDDLTAVVLDKHLALIGALTSPPSTPSEDDLVAAREATISAIASDKFGMVAASDIRSGKHDKGPAVQSALIAIRIERSRSPALPVVGEKRAGGGKP